MTRPNGGGVVRCLTRMDRGTNAGTSSFRIQQHRWIWIGSCMFHVVVVVIIIVVCVVVIAQVQAYQMIMTNHNIQRTTITSKRVSAIATRNTSFFTSMKTPRKVVTIVTSSSSISSNRQQPIRKGGVTFLSSLPQHFHSDTETTDRSTTTRRNNNNNNLDGITGGHPFSSSTTKPNGDGTTTILSTSTNRMSLLVPLLSPFEHWMIQSIDMKYEQVLQLKCPFFKRRFSDFLDGFDTMIRFLIIRHKTLIITQPMHHMESSSFVPPVKNLENDHTNSNNENIENAHHHHNLLKEQERSSIPPTLQQLLLPAGYRIQYHQQRKNKKTQFVVPTIIPTTTTSISSTYSDKVTGLSVEQIYDILLHQDWKNGTTSSSNHHSPNGSNNNNHNSKGYYITGKMTTSIYRDDCYFQGPDPDMPIQGLYKYMNAASQLFVHKSSTNILQSLTILEPPKLSSKQQRTTTPLHSILSSTFFSTTTTSDDDDDNEEDDDPILPMIQAKWILSGKLHLPWEPIVPAIHGTTIYKLDPKTHLIYEHIETWEESVLQAFLQTLVPSLAKYIWPRP